MSKKANPTTVGIFVIGAAFLAVAGILTFSKSRFFADETTFVAYFDSSVTGLDVGAPVQILGVQVGTVSGIKGVIDPGTLDIKVPVYLTLERGSLRTTRALTKEEERIPLERSVEVLIEKGLRAQLKNQSLVTGKLFVSLVFAPDAEAHYHGDGELMEIPSVPGGLQKLAKKLEEIDFEQLVAKATSTLEAVQELIEMPEIAELIRNLNSTVGKLDSLATSAQTLVADADSLIVDSDREVAALSGQARQLLATLGQDGEEILKSLRALIERLDRVTSDYSLAHKTAATLDEFAAAARAIRVLADFLERHPEALIKGKK